MQTQTESPRRSRPGSAARPSDPRKPAASSDVYPFAGRLLSTSMKDVGCTVSPGAAEQRLILPPAWHHLPAANAILQCHAEFPSHRGLRCLPARLAACRVCICSELPNLSRRWQSAFRSLQHSTGGRQAQAGNRQSGRGSISLSDTRNVNPGRCLTRVLRDGCRVAGGCLDARISPDSD